MLSMHILIVIPLYNARLYVGKAIQSILDQTYPRFKLLIINDGSTDGSDKIARAFQDERIVVWDQANNGPGVVMNRAIEFARETGLPYIARMDADDISMPNRLETLLQLITKHDKTAACSSNSYYIDDKTDEVIGNSIVSSSSKLVRWEIFHGLRGLIQGACLFRTDALYDVGGYRSVFLQAEDTDLFLRLAERFELINSPKFLYKIRLNLESLSIKNYRQNVLYQIYALDCSSKRRRGEAELDFTSFRDSLTTMKKVKVWQETKFLELWRNYLIRRSYPSLILASFLSPHRLFARILRKLDNKN